MFKWLRRRPRFLHRCLVPDDGSIVQVWRCFECGTDWVWDTRWVPDPVDLAGYPADAGYNSTGWWLK